MTGATAFYNSINFEATAIMITIAIGILILSFTLLPVFRRFQIILSKVGRVFFLAIKGSGITLVGYGIYLGSIWLISFSKYIEFQPIWIAYGIGGFAGLVCLGYIGENVWNKILKNYYTLNPKMEEKQNKETKVQPA
jgi:hypothetical protein